MLNKWLCLLIVVNLTQIGFMFWYHSTRHHQSDFHHLWNVSHCQMNVIIFKHTHFPRLDWSWMSWDLKWKHTKASMPLQSASPSILQIQLDWSQQHFLWFTWQVWKIRNWSNYLLEHSLKDLDQYIPFVIGHIRPEVYT